MLSGSYLNKDIARLLLDTLKNETDEKFFELASMTPSEDIPRNQLILVAAAHNKLNVIKYLQALPVKTEFVHAQAVALSLAAKYNHINIVRHLMQNSAVIENVKHNFLEENGALTNAIYNGRMDIANLLLSVDGADEALIDQDEARLKWMFETVLSWIAQNNGFVVSNDTPVDDDEHTEDEISSNDETLVAETTLDEVTVAKAYFTEDEKNILSILTPIVHKPGLNIISTLKPHLEAVFKDFQDGESIFSLLMRQVLNKGWFEEAVVLPSGKRARPEAETEDESTKRQETEFSSEEVLSFSSLSSSDSSSSSRSMPEISGLDNFMSDMLLEQMKDLSFKDLCLFILEKNLLTCDIYDNATWYRIAKLLNIRDDWHSELNDDQKLKVDSFFTMMEFAVENYPDTLIHALELSEFVQMPIINNELSKFIVEKNLLTEEAYGAQTWSRIAQLFNLKEEWHSGLNELCAKIDFIAQNFPAPLIEALGLSEMLEMRRLDLGDNTGHTGYLDFVSSAHLGDDDIAIGVDAAMRPFVTFKYDTTLRRKVTAHPESQEYGFNSALGTSVETLFKRYTDVRNTTWVTGGQYGRGSLHRIVEHAGHRLNPCLLNFLNRLSHGKTVGVFDYDRIMQDYAEFDSVETRLSGRMP